jgi:hypothetical protein
MNLEDQIQEDSFEIPMNLGGAQEYEKYYHDEYTQENLLCISEQNYNTPSYLLKEASYLKWKLRSYKLWTPKHTKRLMSTQT